MFSPWFRRGVFKHSFYGVIFPSYLCGGRKLGVFVQVRGVGGLFGFFYRGVTRLQVGVGEVVERLFVGTYQGVGKRVVTFTIFGVLRRFVGDRLRRRVFYQTERSLCHS